MDKKLRFKMYKKGKFWVFAGITIFLTGLSNGFTSTVHADSIESNETPTARINTTDQNKDSSAQESVKKVTNSNAENNPSEDQAENSEKNSEVNVESKTVEKTMDGNESASKEGDEANNERDTATEVQKQSDAKVNEKERIDDDKTVENASSVQKPVDTTINSKMDDKTDAQAQQDIPEVSTPTKVQKQVVTRQAMSMAAVQPQEEKPIKLTAKITNVPSGAFFRTGSRSYNLKSLIDGKFFLTKQTLSENTTWQIQAIYNDQNNDTWYELGNNQWVEGTSLQLDYGSPELESNKRPPLITAVQNKENQPVTYT